MENQKILTIVAILSATILVAGIFAAATPMAAHADYGKKDHGKKDHKKDKKDGSDTSITTTKQKEYQKNVGSGYADNSNCGQNTIASLAVGICQDADVDIDLPYIGGLTPR